MSQWPYDLLEIGDDADERTIKRAYARLLKVTRPDEDPSGFQRLNEAYEAALQHLAGHAVMGPADTHAYAGDRPAFLILPATEDIISVPIKRDVDTAGRSAFDAHAVSGALIACARTATTPDLHRWLAEHPDLMSLDAKDAMVVVVISELEREEPLPTPQIEVILAFFGIHEVLHAYPTLARRIDALRTRSRTAHPTWADLRFRESPAMRRQNPFVESSALLLVSLGALIGLLRMCQGAG
ncbi:DnaJ domain-containing protein [Pseudoxanthomonas sp. PXM02]|uniref:DnaJ domain-containing protein n=1 Tax=Pseudoxanthomonas sp. PXM02 TaxID=2769294 RepID=UPI001CE1412E|nr:DnaJ domain-containing protein [Pseudoxanthomonas sp. PXM02]